MRVTTLLIVTTCAVVACLPSGPVFTDADRDAIVAEKDAFRAAIMNGDAQGAARVYTDDALVMPPGSREIQGKIALVDFFRGVPPVSDFRFTGERFVPAGDLVIVTGRYSMNLLMPGTDIAVADTGKYVEIWRREDGAWKIGWDIWNTDRPMPEPPGDETARRP